MSYAACESLLVALYTQHRLRERFLEDPDRATSDWDLTREEKIELLAMDRSGLVLAANSFAYKRWRANRARFLRCRQLFSYPSLVPSEELQAIAQFHEKQRAAGRLHRGDRAWVQPGEILDLLPVEPTFQIDCRHLFLQDSGCAPLWALWGRLVRLHLRHHHLVRAYLFHALPGNAESPYTRLHDAPGTYTTYVILASAGAEAALELQQGGGSPLAQFTIQPGAVVTVPSDLPQRLVVAAAPYQSQDLLPLVCFKTLATDL